MDDIRIKSSESVLDSSLEIGTGSGSGGGGSSEGIISGSSSSFIGSSSLLSDYQDPVSNMIPSSTILNLSNTLDSVLVTPPSPPLTTTTTAAAAAAASTPPPFSSCCPSSPPICPTTDNLTSSSNPNSLISDVVGANVDEVCTETTTTTQGTFPNVSASCCSPSSSSSSSSSINTTSTSNLCADGKEMQQSLLSTKKPSGRSSSSSSSSSAANKSASKPVPNIKPIISITPVLSSPTISKPMISLGSEKGWDLSHTSIVTALHNQSHGVSRSSQQHHHQHQQQQQHHHHHPPPPHHHHHRKPPNTSLLAVSRSSSPCQLAPIALTTKANTIQTALNLVTNGKVQSGSLPSNKPSSMEKRPLSENESHTGDSSEGSVSSDNSYVSSDNDCENGENNTKETKGRASGTIIDTRPHHRVRTEARNNVTVAARLAAARSNMDAVISGMGLALDVPSSITVTPLGSASPPLNSPLNLSMKKPVATTEDYAAASTLSSMATFTPALSQRGAKRGPKPKHLRGLSALTAEENQLRQRQASLEELKAQLEAQLKQQQMQLRLARKTPFISETTSTPPQIHIQATSSRGKPCIITKNASLSAPSSSSVPPPRPLSPSIIALTKGLSSRSVSLLSGSRSPDLASTSTSSLLYQKHSNYVHSKLSSTPNGALSLIPMDVSEEGFMDRERNLASKFRTLDDESSDNESTDDDDSTGESGDSSTGSDTSGESGSSSSDTEASSGRGQKRGYSSEGSSPTKKSRRLVISDERELRIPLEHGWRRLTKIRTYSFSGARGEVVYFAPCGKKLKTYPEVVRYLEKNGINDIGRENFSFSAKHNVGEYLEPQGNGEYSEIGEGEVVARIEEFRARKGRRYIPVAMRRKMEEKHRRREEMRLRRRLEQQGCMPVKLARKEPEKKVTMRKRRVREKATRSVREAKLLQAAEARRQKDHIRFLRQQEKVEKQEQLRIEREMRSHQMLEARKKRQELLERQRIEETERKNKEREMKKLQAVVMREQELQKRREMLIMVDLERERRRQHMLLVKALETRKKQEERERMREERLEEKRMSRERKMEQRQLEMMFIREMKKPVEDMELKDSEPLPILSRIPGVKLPGQAFADVLMVFEFLHNFGEVLGFDMDSLPTLNTLQMALLNDESCEDELLSVLHHLLTCAIEDPGIPSGPKGKTALNQHLREVDITFGTVSEVLRIFIRATEGPNSKFFAWLSEKPFMALNGTRKAAILAHLCNELLCSRAICRQIDNNIDAVNNVKRDKWMVEGKVRKLRLIHARKVARQQMKTNFAMKGDAQADGSGKATPVKDVKNDDDDDIVNNSDNESVGSHCDVLDEPDEEPGVSVEDLEKKIDKMTKQHNQYRRKLMKATQQLRAVSLGQDRYRRRYWVLPTVGGVYVEGLESSNLHYDFIEERAPKVEVKVENESKDDDVAIEVVKDGLDSSMVIVKEETVDDSSKSVVKEETVDDSNKSVVKEETIVKTEETKEEDVTIQNEEVKMELDKKDESQNLFLQNCDEVHKWNDSTTTEKEKGVENVAVDKSLTPSPPTPPPPPPPPPLLLSQNVPPTPKDIAAFSHGIFSSFGMDPRLLFNSPLNFHANGELNDAIFNKYLDGVSHNMSVSDYCMGLFPVPQCQINAEQILKTFSDRVDEKPWFSILPRMPCDETSLTRLRKPPNNAATTDKDMTAKTCSSDDKANAVAKKDTASFSSPISSCSLPKYPPIQFSPFYFQNSPSFGSMQMGLINGGSSPLLVPNFMSSSPFGVNGSGMNNADGSLLNTTPNGPQSIPFGISPSVWSPALRQQYAALQDLQQQQYPEPQPIPPELKKGWWRITDVSQLKALVQVLHSRGIREKMLQLKLQKYLDITTEVGSKGGQYGDLDLEITDLDRAIAKKFAGAPDPDDENAWNRNVVMRMDMAILEQVENLEEKVASASMQLKYWKLPTKITEEEGMKFHLACDEPSPTEDGEEETIDCEYTPKSVCALKVARERLLSVEAAIERRYVKPPLGYSLASMSSVGNHHHHHNHHYHHHQQQQSNGHNNEVGADGLNSSSSTPQDESPPSPIIEEAPKGLLVWRAAVKNSTTSSQLAVCLNYLEGSVAWDRSIMKASCQFCNSGDNEAMLLLCDGCDKGYHTYCFKPKMESIPEGDWFCYECLNKATGDRVCLFCGKKGKNLCLCDNCPKAYHTDCLDPPMTRVPKTKWHCPQCNNKTIASKMGKNNKNRKSKEPSNQSVSEVDDSPRKSDKSPGSSRADRCKERNKNNSNRDLGPCRDILAELEAHEDAWPFLLPVNTKQFPSYRKVIKRPMDLSTIRSKLDGGTYRNRSDFVFETRLMFNNCETFNEDDSPVGKAGHNLRAFFETLWSDIAEK